MPLFPKLVKVIPFASAIPLNSDSYMPAVQIRNPLHFTLNSFGITSGASCAVSLIADGVNVPTFDPIFVQSNLSQGYVNIAGVLNEVSFRLVGITIYYEIYQSYAYKTATNVAPPPVATRKPSLSLNFKNSTLIN